MQRQILINVMVFFAYTLNLPLNTQRPHHRSQRAGKLGLDFGSWQSPDISRSHLYRGTFPWTPPTAIYRAYTVLVRWCLYIELAPRWHVLLSPLSQFVLSDFSVKSRSAWWTRPYFHTPTTLTCHWWVNQGYGLELLTYLPITLYKTVPDSKVHGANMGPTGPRWAPYWPHEPCYLGWYI